MLKWLLVGWMCTGAGEQQICLRMASEVVHDSFDQCDEYYGVVAEELENQIIYNLIVYRHGRGQYLDFKVCLKLYLMFFFKV